MAARSWTVTDRVPPGSGDKMYALAVARPEPFNPVAYTLFVRVKRGGKAPPLRLRLSRDVDASEIVEGLLLFGSDAGAERFAGMHPDDHPELLTFSVEPESTFRAMRESGGVVVLIEGEDPPNPRYCRSSLLSIAYDLGDVF